MNLVSFKIQRQGSGADLPQTGEFNPSAVARRVNSFHAVAMDDDLEDGNVGLYQERPRTFPSMRSKTYVPLVYFLSLLIDNLCLYSISTLFVDAVCG